jgi:hypothetical protein
MWALILIMKVPSLWLHHLPKSLSPNSIPLCLGFQHTNIWRGERYTNIHTIASLILSYTLEYTSIFICFIAGIVLPSASGDLFSLYLCS